MGQGLFLGLALASAGWEVMGDLLSAPHGEGAGPHPSLWAGLSAPQGPLEEGGGPVWLLWLMWGAAVWLTKQTTLLQTLQPEANNPVMQLKHEVPCC